MNQPETLFLKRLAVCLTATASLLVTVTQSRCAPKPSRAHKQIASKKRLSVLDYYYLLPTLGIGGSATRQEKKLTLSSNHPIIDVKHDYMDFQPDSSPREQLAIFRTRGQADVIADSMPDFVTDYNLLKLYRLEHGKLKDVTREVLPVPVCINRFLYQLPHIGTTIRVYRFTEGKSRQHVFDLQWRQGGFVKVVLNR